MHCRFPLTLSVACLQIFGAAWTQAAALTSADDCKTASQVITSGSPSNKLEWAYTIIPRCGTAAAAPLAAAWSRSASGTEIFWREGSSARILDRRVLSAATAVATSPSRSFDERVSALAVVTQLLVPGRTITKTYWYHAQIATPAMINDIDAILGDQPITTADRSTTMGALDAMASSDPDTQARVVAGRLASFFRSS
jgi:hypothetical protein